MNAPPETGMRLNSRLWPILAGALFLLQLAFPFKGWLILLVGLGGAWLIAYLWARSMMQGLKVDRSMRLGWAHVGDLLDERFKITNASWAPAIWVELVDHSTLPDYLVNRATGVGPNAINQWQTRHTCTRRGLFTLGPTTLKTGDPFGIYSVVIHNPVSTSILVTPPILPLPSIEVASGGRAGEGRRSNRSIEVTVSVSATREFVPGDSFRWIHWASSAHRGQLMVKTFDSIPTGDWWIILDLDRKVQVGEGQTSTEEAGVILAASLASRGLDARKAVGLVASGRELTWLPPRFGESQRWKIMQSLARVSSGEYSLEALLESSGAAFRHPSSLILVTASTRTDWVHLIFPLVKRDVIPTILLLDAASFGGGVSAFQMANRLSQLEIANYVISADLLDPSTLTAEAQNIWKWRVMPTGKAIPIRQPADLTWKTLT